MAAFPHDLRRSAAKALRRSSAPESVIMATGGWLTASMFRRYAIVSSAELKKEMAELERSRAENFRAKQVKLRATSRTQRSSK